MSNKILEKFLDDNTQHHYNYVTSVPIYAVSTGSLKLDYALGGGLPPGIHRFGGASEGGKTSCALETARNFLSTFKNGKVLYIKAEGRLSKKVKTRAQIPFVDTAKDWHAGTAFVVKSNIFEPVAQLIRSLITDPDQEFRYFVIIDSLDAMILQGDVTKALDDGESVKVAGPQVLTKLLFKLISLPCAEYGHIVIPITQVVSNIKIKPEKSEQMNPGGSGGNGAIHFANFILQFMPRWNTAKITSDGEKPKLNFDETNVVGHWCKVELRKTENEVTDLVLEYPVKYGDAGGVWKELELEYFLNLFKLTEKSGAWIKLSDTLVEKMKKSLPSEKIVDKLHGKAKFFDYVADSEVAAFLLDCVRKYLKKDEIL